MKLSKTARNELIRIYKFSTDELDLLENPTKAKLIKFRSHIHNNGYYEGFHKAIEDIKIIVKNVEKL